MYAMSGVLNYIEHRCPDYFVTWKLLVYVRGQCKALMDFIKFTVM